MALMKLLLGNYLFNIENRQFLTYLSITLLLVCTTISIIKIKWCENLVRYQAGVQLA